MGGNNVIARYSPPSMKGRFAMPRTMKEYQHRWQDAIRPGSTKAPWDEELTSESSIICEASRSTPLGEGRSYLPDFGDAICFYRYLRIPEELDTLPESASDAMAELLPGSAMMELSWSRYRSCFSNEEIRRRRYEGERALDKLLGRFAREGYQPGMGEKLIEIVNIALIDFELREVYVLPGDLPALLERFGNPLANCVFSGDERHAVASAPVFDLNAQGHREALAEYLVETEL